ncbi:MAG: cytochrome c [Mucilaginibacter sp.]|nr:cytochrome c [Mucilaginibacter sp.]
MQLNKIVLILLFMFTCAGLKAQVKHKARPKAKTGTANLSASIARGKDVYMQTCVSCHQVDGGGVQNMNPPLIKTTYVLGDKTKLITIVLNGFNESVEINGDSYTNTMPSHDFLKDGQIADVLTYVRNSFGNKAPAVTTAEVIKVRAAVKKS